MSSDSVALSMALDYQFAPHPMVNMGSRMSWPEIRGSVEYRGRWVALDECVYDGKTAEPLEGAVVDADDDLVELCTRIRSQQGRHCAILYCEEAAPISSRRRSGAPT